MLGSSDGISTPPSHPITSIEASPMILALRHLLNAISTLTRPASQAQFSLILVNSSNVLPISFNLLLHLLLHHLSKRSTKLQLHRLLAFKPLFFSKSHSPIRKIGSSCPLSTQFWTKSSRGPWRAVRTKILLRPREPRRYEPAHFLRVHVRAKRRDRGRFAY